MASRSSTKGFLEELHRVAGAEAVAALCKACGGLEIYIPHRRVHRADGPLVRVFGSIEAASVIVGKLNDHLREALSHFPHLSRDLARARAAPKVERQSSFKRLPKRR